MANRLSQIPLGGATDINQKNICKQLNILVLTKQTSLTIIRFKLFMAIFGGLDEQYNF
jgi:hypothetical protein